MNAGLHDAVEIAWRLASVLRGQAASVVLDSYDAERGGEHARLSAQQAKGFRRTVYRGPVTDAALGLAAKVVPGIGALLQGTDDLQQLSVSYPKSPLNEDHLSGVTHLLQRGPGAGERAPQAEVTVDGRTTSLFPFIYNPDGVTTGWPCCASTGGHPKPAIRFALSSRPSPHGSGYDPVSSWRVLFRRREERQCCRTWTARRTAPTAWKANPPSFSSVRMGISPIAARPTDRSA